MNSFVIEFVRVWMYVKLGWFDGCVDSTFDKAYVIFLIDFSSYVAE